MGRAIGIDLGTTYSAVAILQEDGKPAILPNIEGQNITPSVVLFPDAASGSDEPLVGDMDDIVKLVVDAESVKGGFFSSKPGYQYNYDTSNEDTRSTGKH